MVARAPPAYAMRAAKEAAPIASHAHLGTLAQRRARLLTLLQGGATEAPAAITTLGCDLELVFVLGEPQRDESFGVG